MIIDNPGRWLGVFGLVAMVGTISGAMYAGRLYMRRRHSAIISAGIALGFSSAPDDEVRFPEIRLLAGKGSLAKYSNVLKGCSARYETVIFDFSYVTGSGRNSTNLLTVEGYWDWIIVYQPERRVRPSDLGGFLEVSSQIASGLLGQVARPLLAK